MKSSERQRIFEKYNGRCAYCGCELTKGWHVDELLPIKRRYKYVPGHWKSIITGETSPIPNPKDRQGEGKNWIYVKEKHIQNGCDNPENFNIDNQMPSCPSCNINKHSMSLEEFRDLIKGFMKHLNEVSTQYKIAKRYGLVKETDIEVKFYFEKTEI